MVPRNRKETILKTATKLQLLLVAALVVIAAVGFYSLTGNGGGKTVKFEVDWLDQEPAQCFYTANTPAVACDLSNAEHNPDGSGSWTSPPLPYHPGVTYSLVARMNNPRHRVAGIVLLDGETVATGSNYGHGQTTTMTVSWKG